MPNTARRGAGPFELHIREAIELNQQRAPLYAEASGGASLPISRSLIRTERLLLPLARWLDRRAEPYHRAGVPVLEDVFVSMAGAPAFVAWIPVEPAPVGRPPAARAARRRVSAAYRGQRFAGAASALAAELERIRGQPDHWCMLRHMLESALRICTVADEHARRARERGLASPRWISRLLLRLHLWTLPSAARLDSRAYLLQRRGIPILCRDLPPITPAP